MSRKKCQWELFEERTGLFFCKTCGKEANYSEANSKYCDEIYPAPGGIEQFPEEKPRPFSSIVNDGDMSALDLFVQ